MIYLIIAAASFWFSFLFHRDVSLVYNHIGALIGKTPVDTDGVSIKRKFENASYFALFWPLFIAPILYMAMFGSKKRDSK